MSILKVLRPTIFLRFIKKEPLSMKTIIVSVIILLLGSAIYFAVNGFPTTVVDRAPEFTVFYERGTISKFDGGNPVGKGAIIRVNGMNGRPQSIYKLEEGVLAGGNVHVSDSGLEVYEPATYDTLSNMVTTWTKKELDVNGRVESSSTLDTIPNPGIKGTANSPDGAYEAAWSMICLEGVTEGPCPWRFKLDIKNRTTGATKSFGPKDFSLTSELNIYVEVLGFSSNSDKLYAITYMADDFSPGNLAAVNLAAGTISVLEANVLTGPEDQLFFVQPLREQNATKNFYFVKNFLFRTMDELIRLDPVTGERIVVMKYPPALPRIAPNESLVAYNDEFNKGFFVYNTKTKSTQRVVSQGEFLAWAGDSQHVAYQIFTSNNGLGPKKLYVRNIETGQERLIFDQTVVAQGIGTTTKVGDVVYSFIGLL